MNPLQVSCTLLRERLLAAIDLESRLAQKLREHENALLKGEVERINDINRELDQFLDSLKGLACDLREAATALAEILNLPVETPLKVSLPMLPSPSREELCTLRQRLVMARRAAQNASSKNAAIARASIDAIHSVRELLVRGIPQTESAVAADVANDSGLRLDFKA